MFCPLEGRVECEAFKRVVVEVNVTKWRRRRVNDVMSHRTMLNGQWAEVLIDCFLLYFPVINSVFLATSSYFR